jgi:hypothetical protein
MTNKIWCIIEGELSSKAFPIKFEDNITIGTLKELIVQKKKNDFKDIDPNNLNLWKAFIKRNTKADSSYKCGDELDARTTLTIEDLSLENFCIFIENPRHQEGKYNII